MLLAALCARVHGRKGRARRVQTFKEKTENSEDLQDCATIRGVTGQTLQISWTFQSHEPNG